MEGLHVTLGWLEIIGFYVAAIGALFVMYFANRAHYMKVSTNGVVVAMLCVLIGEALIFPWTDLEHWLRVLFIVLVNEMLRASNIGNRFRPQELPSKEQASPEATPTSTDSIGKYEASGISVWQIIAKAIWDWFFPER